MKNYIIKHELKNEYWNNENGWVDRGSADVFTELEKETLDLPIDGLWIDTNQTNNKIRIYVIECGDFDFRNAEKIGDYEAIIEEAEKQGGVYSLEGFEESCNNEDIDLSNSFIYISNKPREEY